MPINWNFLGGGFFDYNTVPEQPIVNNWNIYNSPDYFTLDYPYPNHARWVPLNDFGTAYSKHGNAYGGISVYQGNISDYKEYIYQQLSSPLKADSVYCLSFYTALADRVQIAIKNMGAYFSVNIPTLNNLCLPYAPQVVNTTGFLKDTVNWVEIRGCFTALGGEQYITIGSFGDRASTDTVNTISTNPLTGPGSSFSYYYIDSVTLWKNNFPTFIKEDLKDELVSVYPNPFNGILNVECKMLNDKSELNVIVTDVLGREVMVSEFKEQLNISHLEKGIYFLSLYKSKTLIGTKKIVRE